MKKYLRVNMPDGTVWDVPASVIAHDRARYYACKDTNQSSGAAYDAAYEEEYTATMNDDLELSDWAANNMDWKDVSDAAEQVQAAAVNQYEDGWINGEREIIKK